MGRVISMMDTTSSRQPRIRRAMLTESRNQKAVRFMSLAICTSWAGRPASVSQFPMVMAVQMMNMIIPGGFHRVPGEGDDLAEASPPGR